MKEQFVLVLVLGRIKHLQDYALVYFKVFASVNVGLEALRLFILVLGDPVRAMCSLFGQEFAFNSVVNVSEVLGVTTEFEYVVSVRRLYMLVGGTDHHVLSRTLFVSLHRFERSNQTAEVLNPGLVCFSLVGARTPRSFPWHASRSRRHR